MNASPLGKKVEYKQEYDPGLLFPIPRQSKRDEIGIGKDLPFYGADIWNAYELSWLNPKGKPVVAFAEITVPCTSEAIFESKSLKLYFNSLNQTSFENKHIVARTIQHDLSRAVNAPVEIKIWEVDEFSEIKLGKLNSYCLDQLDIECKTYLTEPNFLTTISNNHVVESIHSNLLRSNCLVTGQPDWGTIEIHYRGKQIDHAGLLRYIVSFRHHIEFHEQCVERIFIDIMSRCKPESLSVVARYTRRGGIDINPYRSTEPDFVPVSIRLCRQ